MDQLKIPDAVLQRIVKAKLPDTVHLAKDARLALHEAAIVFVSYLTTAASDLGKSKNVKTISSALIIQALQELELDALIPAVNETLVQLKATKKKAPSATKSAADANNGSDKGKEDNHDDEHAASSAAAAAAEDADGTEAEAEDEPEDEDEDEAAMEMDSSSAPITDAPEEM